MIDNESALINPRMLAWLHAFFTWNHNATKIHDFPLQPCEQTSSTGYHDLIDNRRAGLGLVITNKLSLANGVEWITEFEVKRLVLLFSHGIMRDSHGSKTQARARSTKKDSFVFH
ncbi:hypothetical protein CC2G_012519 [Coprinopsis cinerea AmutBmut pab1-1]|nr:hypothetical protein CC2G_012519 [Coprinopsis cinerea AmutBmut pab1-1]